MIKIIIEKAKVLRINPKARYLLIFNRKDVDKGDLSHLSTALREFFGEAKVLAIFADQATDVKIAELIEENENTK